MGLGVTARRRWLGALALLAAAAQLILGETVLKGRLENGDFMVYWLSCFALTGFAMLMAFLDLRSLRTLARSQQRELLETTLEKIEGDAEVKQREKGTRKPV